MFDRQLPYVTRYPAAYERLRQWTMNAGVRLEREEHVYALVWHDGDIERLIEVSFAPNAVAARAGVVQAPPDHHVRLEPDKHAMTSWHCAPYERLEELLAELRAITPEREAYATRK